MALTIEVKLTNLAHDLVFNTLDLKYCEKCHIYMLSSEAEMLEDKSDQGEPKELRTIRTYYLCEPCLSLFNTTG